MVRGGQTSDIIDKKLMTFEVDGIFIFQNIKLMVTQ
jgi:hypothetical protein